jgi:hypothetical protein
MLNVDMLDMYRVEVLSMYQVEVEYGCQVGVVVLNVSTMWRC